MQTIAKNGKNVNACRSLTGQNGSFYSDRAMKVLIAGACNKCKTGTEGYNEAGSSEAYLRLCFRLNKTDYGTSRT
jgi:hypothetical protein